MAAAAIPLVPGRLTGDARLVTCARESGEGRQVRRVAVDRLGA